MSDKDTIIEALTMQLRLEREGNLALAKREWVGLTRDEVLDIEETTTHPLEFARAIEAKLKEKNT